MTQKKIGSIDDFPEGEATKAKLDNIPLAVFNINGEFYAVVNNCPHKNLPFDLIGKEAIVSNYESREQGKTQTLGGINEEELTIRCPWHNLKWDLETGESPFADVPLRTFDVVTEGDSVFVEF